jgi:hypothetical protein
MFVEKRGVPTQLWREPPDYGLGKFLSS